jgi:hypothetical protein
MAEFEPDIPLVVAALLSCRLPAFGQKALHDVISFAPKDLQSTRHTAERINAGFLVPQDQPFRQLMAATTIAFHLDPARYAAVNRQQSVLERILLAMPPGVRGRELTDAARAHRDAGDVETGRSFADLFAEAPRGGQRSAA